MTEFGWPGERGAASRRRAGPGRSVAYPVLPVQRRMTAIAAGSSPTENPRWQVSVAVVMDTTAPGPRPGSPSMMKAVVPSGVNAMAPG